MDYVRLGLNKAKYRLFRRTSGHLLYVKLVLKTKRKKHDFYTDNNRGVLLFV